MSNDNTSSLILAVAGLNLVLKVRSAERRIVEVLADRYQNFLGAGEASLSIDIDVDVVKDQVIVDTQQIQFIDNDIRFMEPAYEGCINPYTQQARLSLKTSRPIEAIDYFLRVALASMALRKGGLLIHAAGIVRKGHAYLFYGHSGSGKTTVAKLSPKDIVLNDDLVLLLPPNEVRQEWMAYATPFWNPSQVTPTHQSAPLAAMFHLVQSQQVYIETMKPAYAVAELIASIPVLSLDPGHDERIVEVVLSLLSKAPSYQLHFLPDDTFWKAVELLPAK